MKIDHGTYVYMLSLGIDDDTIKQIVNPKKEKTKRKTKPKNNAHKRFPQPTIMEFVTLSVNEQGELCYGITSSCAELTWDVKSRSNIKGNERYIRDSFNRAFSHDVIAVI